MDARGRAEPRPGRSKQEVCDWRASPVSAIMSYPQQWGILDYLDTEEYITNFWDYDNSPYIREKLRKNHGIHRRYCKEQSGVVKKYWIPFFGKKLLGEITRQDVESFIEYFETLPQKQGVRIPQSAKRKNTIIQAGTIALSWAFNKGTRLRGGSPLCSAFMEQGIFNRELRLALIQAGMSKESAKAYTFHGWRHYFTAYMRERITEKLLQQQTGHKTLDMLDHYSGHKIAGDRERIRQAQIETFGSLLPYMSEAVVKVGA